MIRPNTLKGFRWITLLSVAVVLPFFQNCGQPGISVAKDEVFESSSVQNPYVDTVQPPVVPPIGATPTPTPSPTPVVLNNLWAGLVANINPPKARYGQATAWLGDKMMMATGISTTTLAETDVNFYNPNTGVWTAGMSLSQGRFGAKAVWTGSKVIMFGGYFGATRFQGEVYDPVLNTWTALPETVPLRSRSHHAMVWTGSRVLVFGGYYLGGLAGSSDLNDGGSYNPATGTWTPLSQVGAPSARQWISAVWTGTKMVVWGGSHCAAPCGAVSLYNNGALYDPVTNTWSPMSMVGAPTPREGSSMVWTGSKVLIFGGDINAAEVSVADGAMYDPATDTWSPMANLNAPSARTLSSAVWTGTRMIQWGGMVRVNGVRTGLNNGGIYY